jgi:hypothetical protein
MLAIARRRAVTLAREVEHAERLKAEIVERVSVRKRR